MSAPAPRSTPGKAILRRCLTMRLRLGVTWKPVEDRFGSGAVRTLWADQRPACATASARSRRSSRKVERAEADQPRGDAHASFFDLGPGREQAAGCPHRAAALTWDPPLCPRSGTSAVLSSVSLLCLFCGLWPVAAFHSHCTRALTWTRRCVSDPASLPVYSSVFLLCFFCGLWRRPIRTQVCLCFLCFFCASSVACVSSVACGLGLTGGVPYTVHQRAPRRPGTKKNPRNHQS